MEETQHKARTLIERHRFSSMIALTLFIGLLLVIMAMNLYNSSGAAQVDMSQPGYQSVRQQSVQKDDIYAAFPSMGDVDEKTLKDFKAKFDPSAKRVVSANAFSQDVLSDEALGLSEESPIGEQSNE